MKSHASDLTEVVAHVYIDAATKCTANEPDVRDLQTLRSRVECEGLSFLTITLPSFGSDFEKCLAKGMVDSTLFRSFRKRGRAPAFLQGFLSQVFDTGTGRILNEPSIEAIEGIRQVAYALKKLKLSCTAFRVRAAVAKFKQDEQDLSEALDPGDIDHFDQVSRVLWGNALSGLCLDDATPKHGPGATAERISGNQKYCCERWHDRLEPYFPLLSNAFSSESAYGSGEFERVTVVCESDEQPVRVITVPKTLKAPRIIAIEPVCMQYTQQAISNLLVTRLESHPLTSRHVNFTCQDINRELALRSSKDGMFATLDMSSASDRVPLSLALSMFRSNPDLMGAIEACRSKTAQLPDGDVLSLKKFASMGSALCFPVEAMYFYTICVGARLKLHNLPVTYLNVRSMSRSVYVYGDDIIVPTNEAVFVGDHLQKYYCKVNMLKSFWNGSFRESCGMDAYKGEEVTPTYVRSMPPTNKRNAEALVSWVETSNLFYKRGYWRTSDHMMKRVESILGKLPIVSEDSPALGRVSFQHSVSIDRWGSRYQRPEVKAWVATPVYRTDRLDGYSALLKSLLGLSRRHSVDDSVDAEHLGRTARHGAVTLKRRWCSPF